MAPHPQRLSISRRAWPLARPFATARGVTTTAEVVVADLSDGDSRGRGEGVPVAPYGETIDSVVAALEAMKGAVSSGLTRETLQLALPPGGARAALDSAFWDIEAKRAYSRVTDLIGLAPLAPIATGFTIGLDTPEAMAALAATHRARPWLTVKLGGDGDADRLQAVREAAPTARLLVDADGGWTAAQFAALLPTLRDCRVELIEQPLPAEGEAALRELASPIPLCADESCRTVADLDRLDGLYQAVAISLDKTGGLSEALALAAEARRRGLRIVASGSIGTSLGVAPALLIAQQADIVDLSGPLLLAADRVPGLRYEGTQIHPPEETFWG